MPPDCDYRDEQIAMLRERVAKLEAQLDSADKALTLAEQVKEETRTRRVNLIIGIITVGLMAVGTMVSFVVHLVREASR